ncbi:hypothetical protein DXU77_09070 [Pseudomonas lactis]|nr:hypothetical protein [Pseudomonas lactis]
MQVEEVVHGKEISFYVGASLLAKNSRAPRSCWFNALSLTIFASKLAPTGDFAGAGITRCRCPDRQSISSGSGRRCHRPGRRRCPC